MLPTLASDERRGQMGHSRESGSRAMPTGAGWLTWIRAISLLREKSESETCSALGG